MTPSAWPAICSRSTDGLPRWKPSQEARRAELDEVAVAGRRGGQQRQVEAVEPVAAVRGRAAAGVVVDDVDLAAEDRLDAVLAAGREQLDGAVHHPVVGESEGRLTERRGPRREVVDLARPVEQRVLGVDVEVGAGGAHADASSIGGGADGAVPRNHHVAGRAAVRSGPPPGESPERQAEVGRGRGVGGALARRTECAARSRASAELRRSTSTSARRFSGSG